MDISGRRSVRPLDDPLVSHHEVPALHNDRSFAKVGVFLFNGRVNDGGIQYALDLSYLICVMYFSTIGSDLPISSRASAGGNAIALFRSLLISDGTLNTS